MKMTDFTSFMRILKRSNRPPEDGKTKEEWGLITFEEFDKDLRALVSEGKMDAGLLSMIGHALQLQYTDARSTEIKRGMLNLMVFLADWCFYKNGDSYEQVQLTRVDAQIARWKKEVDELDARTKRLETLSPDDILNAPMPADIPQH